MNGVRVVLATIGLILVGMLAWWVLKLVFGLAFYLILGVIVVAGGYYLVTRAARPTPSRASGPNHTPSSTTSRSTETH